MGRMTFVWDLDKKHKINLAHVRTLDIEGFAGMQTGYVVRAHTFSKETYTLYKGTKEGCQQFIDSLMQFGGEQKTGGGMEDGKSEEQSGTGVG